MPNPKDCIRNAPCSRLPGKQCFQFALRIQSFGLGVFTGSGIYTQLLMTLCITTIKTTIRPRGRSVKGGLSRFFYVVEDGVDRKCTSIGISF